MRDVEMGSYFSIENLIESAVDEGPLHLEKYGVIYVELEPFGSCELFTRVYLTNSKKSHEGKVSDSLSRIVLLSYLRI